MTNWLPTVGGIITAAGIAMAKSDDPTVKMIGQILSILGPVLLGVAAKQFNVTGGTVIQPTPAAITIEKLEEANITVEKEKPCN